jgi:hypothetical protein
MSFSLCCYTIAENIADKTWSHSHSISVDILYGVVSRALPVSIAPLA